MKVKFTGTCKIHVGHQNFSLNFEINLFYDLTENICTIHPFFRGGSKRMRWWCVSSWA